MTTKRIDFPVTREQLAESISTCRACGARIVWQARKPLHEASKEWREGKFWLESHFAHCPRADEFRRKPAVKEAMREVATESDGEESRT